ncbi:hypothetical protein ACS5UA_17625 [Brucella sp. RRSP16]|uniref:hypothetical protein n=1 Tax=Brucella ciceri TaxID=391287 RepID=UPI0013AF1A0B|nr:hypothetical protein [Brucella ciceri]MCH6205564.1 hypothetical protein [Brucella ciceri]
MINGPPPQNNGECVALLDNGELADDALVIRGRAERQAPCLGSARQHDNHSLA